MINCGISGCQDLHGDMAALKKHIFHTHLKHSQNSTSGLVRDDGTMYRPEALLEASGEVIEIKVDIKEEEENLNMSDSEGQHHGDSAASNVARLVQTVFGKSDEELSLEQADSQNNDDLQRARKHTRNMRKSTSAVDVPQPGCSAGFQDNYSCNYDAENTNLSKIWNRSSTLNSSVYRLLEKLKSENVSSKGSESIITCFDEILDICMMNIRNQLEENCPDLRLRDVKTIVSSIKSVQESLRKALPFVNSNEANDNPHEDHFPLTESHTDTGDTQTPLKPNLKRKRQEGHNRLDPLSIGYDSFLALTGRSDSKVTTPVYVSDTIDTICRPGERSYYAAEFTVPDHYFSSNLKTALQSGQSIKPCHQKELLNVLHEELVSIAV